MNHVLNFGVNHVLNLGVNNVLNCGLNGGGQGLGLRVYVKRGAPRELRDSHRDSNRDSPILFKPVSPRNPRISPKAVSPRNPAKSMLHLEKSTKKTLLQN